MTDSKQEEERTLFPSWPGPGPTACMMQQVLPSVLPFYTRTIVPKVTLMMAPNCLVFPDRFGVKHLLCLTPQNRATAPWWAITPIPRQCQSNITDSCSKVRWPDYCFRFLGVSPVSYQCMCYPPISYSLARLSPCSPDVVVKGIGPKKTNTRSAVTDLWVYRKPSYLVRENCL